MCLNVCFRRAVDWSKEILGTKQSHRVVLDVVFAIGGGQGTSEGNGHSLFRF